MATYESFMVEAEGFQGKMTPNHDAKKGAISVQNLLGDNKPKPKSKPGALAIRPTTRAVVPGKLAVRPGALVAPKNRNTKTTKEPVGATRAQAAASANRSANSSSSSGKPSSSGRPFRRVVRDAEAASKSNSPARGSEVRKSDKDLAQKQRDRVLYNKARKERDLTNRLDREDRRGEGIRKGLSSIRNNAVKGAKAVANSARDTQQDKGEKMQDAQVSNVKRGIYNP